MLILSYIEWPDGNTTERIINFSNSEARQQFGAFSRNALKRGAVITTKALNKEELDEYNKSKNTEQTK